MTALVDTVPPTDDGGGPARVTPWWRTFGGALALIALAGLALRLGYVLTARHGVCGGGILVDGCPGDAWVYRRSALLLADGQGFVNPVEWVVRNRAEASADHPPLLIVVLAAFSWVGLRSWTAHQLVIVAIGTASVIVAGLVGREVGGRRLGTPIGLVAAALVALSPNVWLNDGNVLSESPAILLVLGIAWAAYRLWARPSWGRAAVTGALIGLAMLVRPESGLLIVLIGLPVVLGRRGSSGRDRIVHLVALGAAAGIVCLPWVGYNLTRFNHPVTLSTGFGITLANTNCDITYYGDRTGYWSPGCIPEFTRSPGADQSDDERYLRQVGTDYIRSHTRRYPVVVLARLGRMFNVYRVGQQVQLDTYEGRPVWAGRLGLAFFYPTLALAALGAVALRRRRVPVSPLVGPVVLVVVTATITFGHARYRAPAEGVLCVLAAVGIHALALRVRAGRRRARADRRSEPGPPPAAAAGAPSGTAPEPPSTP